MNAVSRTPKAVLTPRVLRYGLFTCVGVVVAHAFAYLTHEYAHSLTAWLLGWMVDPWQLDYGQPTLYNILFLGGVADNVDYQPILAGGHGLAVLAIALAGIFVGNMALYFAMYRLAQTRFVSSRPAVIAGTYWIALMCAGNVWGYVPIRGFTTHADIAIAASGLQLPTWALGLCLLPFCLYVVWHCLCRFLARHVENITARSQANLVLVVLLSSYWLFAFYGADGTSGDYGVISQLLSITSKYFLFPLSAVFMMGRFGWIDPMD